MDNISLFPFYRIVIFKKDSGYLQIDLTRYQIRRNTAYIIPPDQITFLNKAAGNDFITIEYSISELKARNKALMYEATYTGNLQQYSLLSVAAAFGQYQIIFKNFKNKKISADQILDQLFEDYVPQMAPGYSSLHYVDLFIDFLSQPGLKNAQTYLTNYCNEYGISLRTLNRACNHIIGFSSKRIVRHALLSKSILKLLTTDLTIGEIADALGFNDATNFTRFVRENANSTPRDIRNNLLSGTDY